MASGNILYPGYYPGQPVIRSPRGGRPKYNEYTYGAIDEYLNQFNIYSADIGAVPRWIWERAWKDVEETLGVIYVKPESTSYTPEVVKDFPEEQIQELSGVSAISLNLNPADWVEDPRKQVKKTLKNWSGAVFRWDDFNVRAQRELVWNPLIDGKSIRGFSGRKVDTSGFQFARKTKGTDLGTRGEIPAGSLTPLQLTGLGVTYKSSRKGKKSYNGTEWISVEEDVDAFEEVGRLFKDFTQKVDSAITRYDAYTGLQLASIKALDASLKKSFGSGSNMDATERSRVKDENGNDILDARGNYVTAIDKDKSVNAYNAGHYKSVIVNENDAMLAEGFMVQAFYAEQLESLEKAQSKLSTAMEKLVSGVGDTQTALEEVNKRLRSLSNQVTYTEIAIGKMQKFKSTYAGANSIPFFRNLDTQLGSVRSSLGRFSSLARGSGFKTLLANADTKSRLEAVRQAMGMRSELVATGKGMFGGDILTNRGLGFKGGYYEQYLGRMMNSQLLSHPDSTFSKMLRNHHVIGGQRLASYMTYAAKIYDYNDFKDLITNIEGGKYLNLYGWTFFLRERYKYLTPAYYTELFMKKMHYFGLNIHDGSSVKAFKIADKLFKNRLFANRFKLTGSGGMLLVQGGAHFAVPIEMLSSLLAGGFGTITVVNGEITNIDPATIGRFFDYLNGKLFAGMETPEDAGKWLKKLGNFKAWLMKDDNYKKFGIAVVNGEIVQSKENLDRLAKLFKQIKSIQDSKGHINPTVEYLGLLQRLSSRLNAIQSWLYKSKAGQVLAKFISVVYYLKTTIAEAVAGFVTGLLAIGTEGIGAIIGPIVDRLVKYVVIKILDFGEMILKAVFKLDFSDLGEMLEKGFNLILKTAGLIFLVFGLAMVGVIFVITTVISAIPPSDPVKGGDFFVGGTNSENGFAENEYIAVNKDVTVTYKDASGTDVTLDNPESIPAEAVDGSGTQVKYVIKIHAKSDVKSIEYKDTVTYSPAIGSSEIQTFTSSGLTSIKGNEDLIINLPATDSILLNDGKYKNTMIINTITINGESEVDFLKSFELSATRNFIIGEFLSTCPLMGGSVSTGSYDGWAGDGHGTNGYWRAQTKKCFYAIPYLSISTGGANSGIDDCTAGLTGGAACAPSSSTELCNLHNQTSCSTCNNSTYHRTPKQPYYGYAADIVSGDDAVYAPQIPGVLGWKQASIPIPIFERARGYGVLFVSDDSQWLMYLGHINEPFQSRGDTYGVGEKISDLFTNPGSGWKQHVHVELSQQQADGYIPIKPESLICK